MINVEILTDEPAVLGGYHFQDSYNDEQGIDHHLDDDFDFLAAEICAKLCGSSPLEVVPKYKKWIGLRSVLRFWISMSKRKRLAEGQEELCS